MFASAFIESCERMSNWVYLSLNSKSRLEPELSKLAPPFRRVSRSAKRVGSTRKVALEGPTQLLLLLLLVLLLLLLLLRNNNTLL